MAKPSAPIPGSTRDREIQARVQAQADRLLPGIVDKPRVKRERGPVAQAWGEAFGAAWLAWALTRRKAWVRWGLRVLTLTLLLILSQPVLWVLVVPVCVVWNVAKGVNALERRADARRRGECTCGAGHKN